MSNSVLVLAVNGRGELSPLPGPGSVDMGVGKWRQGREEEMEGYTGETLALYGRPL